MVLILWVPCATIYLNLCLSRTVPIFHPHWRYAVGLDLLYTVANYIGTKDKGILYSFIPWTDFFSFVVAMSMIRAVILMYAVLCYILNMFKVKPSEYRSQSISSALLHNDDV